MKSDTKDAVLKYPFASQMHLNPETVTVRCQYNPVQNNIAFTTAASEAVYCCSVNLFDFAREKCWGASVRMQFFQFKIERMNRQQGMFCFNHASAFYTNNNNIVMLINNKFMPQTLTGIPTGNLTCHVLAPRALNMSCRCGQSARSIETGEYLIPHLGLTDQLWGVFGILKKNDCIVTAPPSNQHFVTIFSTAKESHLSSAVVDSTLND